MEEDKNTNIENISSWDDLKRFVSELIPSSEKKKTNIWEEKMSKNNVAVLAGRVIAEPRSAFHTKTGEYFRFLLEIRRSSGILDTIPVTILKELANVIKAGDFVRARGEFRSCNKKRHLILSFAAETVEVVEQEDENEVILNAYICKKPTYRVSPLGKHISDLLIAVHRESGKSDYIPAICWGKNAFVARGFSVGTQIRIIGRLQSREYKKVLDNGEVIVKTAYEVSINKMEVIEECQE